MMFIVALGIPCTHNKFLLCHQAVAKARAANGSWKLHDTGKKAPTPPKIAPPTRLLRVPKEDPKDEEDNWPEDDVDVVVEEEPEAEAKETEPV